MNLTIWGAARQVTGSMHLIDTGNYRLLIDCGLDYEQQRHFNTLNDIEFPFNPAFIDAVILTHSHIDHSGNLPTLVKKGFRGSILCTPPTADITGLLLTDSLNIMEHEIRKKQGKSRKKKPSALYSFKNVKETLDRMVTVLPGKPFRLNDEIEMTFTEPGHLLGAASVYLEIKTGGRVMNIGFTGDLGNYSSQLVKDPEPMENLDYLVTESTYGGRQHSAARTKEDELLHYITETCVNQPGRLIIPAFSVGRTHAIVYTLNKLFRKGILPPVKIFVDSPLAMKTAAYHYKYLHYLNKDAQDFYARHKTLFDFDYLHWIEDAKQSEEIKQHYEPCVIISAAGMVEGGRIQQHIKDNISNSKATVLIAGYCAEGTLGYRLLQGQPTISINNKELKVYAKVSRTDAFSAHPDNEGLVRYVSGTMHPGLKSVFLVHGEERAITDLKENLAKADIKNVIAPFKGEKYNL